MVHKTLRRILGCALLLYGNSALAFTLITMPEQLRPSTAITDSFTLDTQVQPIAGSIRGQILGHLRPRTFRKTTQLGGIMLASNAHSNNRSDVTFLASATDGASGSGSGGSGSGDSESLWVNTTADLLENTFSRTAFHGVTQNIIVGYDLTRSNQFVFGVSGGYEASNFTTEFNNGDERTIGVNLNPYFAWLLSDIWSLDVIGGYGKFNTNQSRKIATGPLTTTDVTSKFSSTRAFASTNVTGVAALGDWKLTGSLGYVWSRREAESYTESLGTTIDESTQTSKQWNALAEVAYGYGNSETFLGARYEDILDYKDIVLTAGQQAANDPTSVLVTAGWRYFGRDLSANIAVNTRLSQEDVRGYGFSMLLRINL